MMGNVAIALIGLWLVGCVGLLGRSAMSKHGDNSSLTLIGLTATGMGLLLGALAPENNIVRGIIVVLWIEALWFLVRSNTLADRQIALQDAAERQKAAS